MSINTYHLKLFVTVAKTGHVTKTAERLRISQPAVSMQIRRLEEDFGVPLLAHHGRRIALTDAGQTFLEYAESILGLESQLRRSMEEYRNAIRGRILVGASSVIGTYHLPRRIRSFQNVYPGIDVEMTLHPDSELEKLVLDGDIDLGLTVTGPKEHIRLRVTKYRHDRWIGIIAPGPVSDRILWLSRDLPQAPIEALSPTRDTRWLDNTEEVRGYVRAQLGPAITLESVVADDLKKGVLKKWPVFEPAPVSLFAMTRPAERLSVNLWRFVEHVTTSGRQSD